MMSQMEIKSIMAEDKRTHAEKVLAGDALPDSTANFTVSKEYEDKETKKKESKSVDVKLYANLQDVLTDYFKGQANDLVRFLNFQFAKDAGIRAYQAARLAVVGEDTMIESEANRIFKRATDLNRPISKERALELAKQVFASF